LPEDAAGLLGPKVVNAFGPNLNLLIKLTQAKGNSFQVHLPEGKTLGDWQPKPEAWFYLAPGLYTFGLKAGTSFNDYAATLHAIDTAMHRLGDDIQTGRKTPEAARAEAERLIRERDPYAYVNVVEAHTDDIVDLTAGGIHHSWEEDDGRFSDGNLVYEVQVDVPDEKCSMRGFDKGKFLPGGGLRPTHVADYLATLETDPEHNDPGRHVRRPETLSDTAGAKVEALFRTPYFCLDRVSLDPGASLDQDLAGGFHHLFVHQGAARIGDAQLEQGRSYLLPAAMGEYTLRAVEGARDRMAASSRPTSPPADPSHDAHRRCLPRLSVGPIVQVKVRL
jgi:hypothetical protein